MNVLTDVIPYAEAAELMQPTVGPQHVHDQRDSLALGPHRVFAALFPPVDGTGTGLLAPAHGADVAGVHDEAVEVELVRMAQPCQQDRLDRVPDAGGLPVAQAV